MMLNIDGESGCHEWEEREKKKSRGNCLLTFFLSLYLASFPPHPFPLYPLSLFSTSALSPFSPFLLLLSSLSHSLLHLSSFPTVSLTLQSQQLRSTSNSQCWTFSVKCWSCRTFRSRGDPCQTHRGSSLRRRLKVCTCTYMHKLCSYSKIYYYSLTDAPQQQTPTI